ncbi:restriction endonuclease subunit S [Paenibacillus macerans]|uniref:restriction endonuclease subunit S n=1 Tax=Paenibacillus macerans TaxID=44252 RepID=UPI00203B3F93|nr:restriction endonuclease subunit S [Paenibacillus macerans]MCM3700466.1 restriction endonuclease subunit S [Paenibacillus macerans]
MSREQSYLNMLDAAAKIQWNVAMILEAKAVEAEKVRNWILNHVLENSFEDHEKQLSDPLDVHEQLVEVIEGLTKLQNGLCSNLKSLLPEEEEKSMSGDDGGFSGLFGGSFDLEDSGK